jgi:hypothetical protein
VPSVRFSRDKRGYEYVYLVHTPVKRGRPGRQRMLYWYRTPPGVRVGRKPFDEDVQRLLEQQNPDLTFDWETIIATPMPPPDMTEFWRERRRLEKAARQERRAEEAAEQAERQAVVSGGAPGEMVQQLPAEATADQAMDAIAIEPNDGSDADDPSDDSIEDETGDSDGAAEGAAASSVRRRRRRPRGPKRGPSSPGSPDSGAQTS